MMNDYPHTSSASYIPSKEDVDYQKETDINTFTPSYKETTQGSAYPQAVLRSAHADSSSKQALAIFNINISKISRQESTLRLNRILSGEQLDNIPTSNE